MKIFKDTLMQNGKYSRKSLTAFVAFICSVLIGFYIVIVPLVNIYAISVFYGFLGLSGGTLGLTVIDKVKNSK
jgi:uncharacterized membrane protein HdeD (DUF308 family)